MEEVDISAAGAGSVLFQQVPSEKSVLQQRHAACSGIRLNRARRLARPSSRLSAPAGKALNRLRRHES